MKPAFLLPIVMLSGSVSLAAVAPLPGTLQGLIDLGSTGVTIGDKTFYDFSYQGQPAAASDITVVQAPGSNLGVEFQYHWTSSNANNQDAVIRYKVHVNDTTPQNQINGVHLSFNGTATGSDGGANTDLLTNASVTETIDDLSGKMLGQISVFDAGSNFSLINRDSDALVVTPTRDLMLEKDIMVHSSKDGGIATISMVDNTFQQTTAVPLPAAAWMGLLALALSGLAPVRRPILHLIGA